MALNRRAGCANPGVLLRKAAVFAQQVSDNNKNRANARKLICFLGVVEITHHKRRSFPHLCAWARVESQLLSPGVCKRFAFIQRQFPRAGMPSLPVPWSSTARSGEWLAWFSFWFSERWRALSKGTAWAGLLFNSQPSARSLCRPGVTLLPRRAALQSGESQKGKPPLRHGRGLPLEGSLAHAPPRKHARASPP